MASGKNAVKMLQKFFPKVEKVLDAKKELDIEVTPRDVVTSKRYKHAQCAMAVACKRAKQLDGVVISRSRAYLIKGTEAVRYELPDSVSREVVSFDRGGGFAPGEYSLVKVHKNHVLGTRGGSNEGNGNGDPIHRHVTTGVRAILGSKEAEAEA